MSVIVQAGDGLIGKSSPSSDFSVLQRAQGSDSFVEARARDCLQMHLETEGAASTFLFSHSNAWWLCHAESESGSDNSGRPKSRIRFTLVSGPCDYRSLINLLVVTSPDESDAPLRFQCDPQRVSLPEATPRSRRALLELVLSEELAVTGSANEAVWTLEAWGAVEQPMALMYCNGRVPSRSRLGKMLVITPNDRTAVTAVKEVFAWLGERDIPDVATLSSIATPEARHRLLNIWGGRIDVPLDGLTHIERGWLVSAGFQRVQIISNSTAVERREWLLEGRLNPVEIDASADLWIKGDEPDLARSLSGKADGLRVYLRCARPDIDQVLRFLPATEAAVLSWIMAGCLDPAPNDMADCLVEFERAGLLDRLDLATLSRVTHVRSAEVLYDAWIRSLENSGMPRSVALALSGGPTLDFPPSEPPVLAPSMIWLSAVTGDHLLNAGKWACGNRDWRQWWLLALGTHPATSQFLPSETCTYSPIAMHWLVAEVGDAELPVEMALTVLARWRSEVGGPRPSPEETETVLKTCRIRESSFWSRMIDKLDIPKSMIPDRMAKSILKSLCDAGLIRLNDVVDSVLKGVSEEWLDDLASRGAIALIAQPAGGKSPPSGRPEDWSPALVPLLSRRVSMFDFWNQWRETGVREDLLQWLKITLEGFEGGSLVQSVAVALQGGTRLRLEFLRVVAPALTRAAKVEQAAMWALSPEREDVFRTLTESQPIPAIAWLKGRVGYWGFNQPIPLDVTCRELTALLPWLDPATAVQTAMSWPDLYPEEDLLLERLVVSVGRCCHGAAPPPPDDAAARRPDWVLRFASIPGWEAWTPVSGPLAKPDTKKDIV